MFWFHSFLYANPSVLTLGSDSITEYASFNKNDFDLKEVNLKDLIKKIIIDKKYKKDQFTKHLLYSLMEIYFRKNVTVKNIRLLEIQNYFIKKINNTKIFNLDDETLLMEFEDRVLNG